MEGQYGINHSSCTFVSRTEQKKIKCEHFLFPSFLRSILELFISVSTPPPAVVALWSTRRICWVGWMLHVRMLPRLTLVLAPCSSRSVLCRQWSVPILSKWHCCRNPQAWGNCKGIAATALNVVIYSTGTSWKSTYDIQKGNRSTVVAVAVITMRFAVIPLTLV